MSFRPALAAAFAVVTLLGATPSPGHAQAPKGAETLSRQAVAESLKVLDKLSAEVKQNPKDATRWYHRAMVAFALSIRADQKDTIPELDYRKLRIIGGDSFLEALNLDPKNGRYKLSQQDFAITDRYFIARAAGRPVTCDINLDHYTDPDIALRQAMLIHNGWVCWVDFDGYENRAQANFKESIDPSRGPVKIPDIRRGMIGTVDAPGSSAPTSVTNALASAHILDSCSGYPVPLTALMQAATGLVNEQLHALPFDVAGETDYLAAKRVFEAAYALDPKGPQAYSSLVMVLGARDNWADLQRIARNQTLVTPDDPWTWMTVALATYRLHPSKESRDMFESAFARLNENERNRLDRLDRVLRPTDAIRFRAMDAATKQSAASSSWQLADPLWSVPGAADPRTEFLARVTYAELRWSMQGLHGSDTERGQVFIRYGPPNRIVGFQPNAADSMAVGRMHTFWIYEGNLIFAFDKHLHTGSATVNACDRTLNERVASEVPARWDNIALTRIDSMPTQAARFRAGADSVELFLATKAPVDTMRALAGVANSEAFAHMWLMPFGPGDQFIDSVKLGPAGNLQWIRRVTPGPYYYRVEATASGTFIAGRTASQLMLGPDSASGFRLIGFGLSDIVIASRTSGVPNPRRWSDLDIVPVLGAIARGSDIALVWENYELGRQGQAARYDVAVTIDREIAKQGAIVARIANMAGVGVNASKDKVAMKFERTVPYAPVLTESVTLALGATPPGSYRLTVQVTDRVSGRTSSRAVRIVIHE